MTIHYASCTFCDSVCGLEIEVTDNQIQSIRGDSADPFSRGHICPKALAQKELIEDPDRLRKPLRRRGSDWEQISWPEALEELTQRTVAIQRQHGNDAMALYYGNPLGQDYQALLALVAFVKALATKNVYSSTSVDALPRMLVSKLLYGNQALLPIPDIERTDLFVVMGANPIVSNGSAMTAPDIKNRLRAIRNRGGRIVVIDPRRTETAKVADEHHFIRPGTDALFLLAILNELFVHGRVTPDANVPIRNLDGLRRIAEPYTPSRVAPLCGVSAIAIETLAQQFAEAPTAAWYGRMGTSTQRFGCLATWLIDVINVVTGNFDRAGGVMFNTPAADLAGIATRLGETGHFDRWRSRVGDLPEFNGEFPVGALADEIVTPGPGQIRGLITIAGNPVLSNPNGRRLDEAFETLDFVACVDFYLNETTRHADLILPPVTPLEGSHYPLLPLAMGVRNMAHYAKPVVVAPPGSKHDWQIILGMVAGLARARGGLQRLVLPALAGGFGSLLGSGRLLDLLLRLGPHRLKLSDLEAAPHGLDLGLLEPRASQVLATKDRSIDLLPGILEADLARLEAELGHDGARGANTSSNDLLLISRRTLQSMNSWLNNLPLLVRGKDRCTLLMNPDDANSRGIEAGKKVRLSGRVGSIEVELRVSDEMMPGVVCLPYGGGHDRDGTRLRVASNHAGVSMNDVVDERLMDELAGTAVLDGIPVEVAPVAPPG